jgi:hypothetical protein
MLQHEKHPEMSGSVLENELSAMLKMPVFECILGRLT